MNKSFRKLCLIAFIASNLNTFGQTLKERAEAGDKVAQYEYAHTFLPRATSPNENFMSEHYQNAFIWFLKSAAQGYDKAQFQVGYCYNTGEGVKQDYEKAFEWYLKSAQQGSGIAMNNIGILYEHGNGVQKSPTKAFEYYKKAYDAGYKKASFNIALCYYHAIGVPMDNKQAFKLFDEARSEGYDRAYYYLGQCYEHGYGVQKDYAKAVKYYQKCYNDTDAEYALANLYLEGKGVEQDSIVAADYLLHAAGGGWCYIHQKFSYDKNKTHKKAREKLIDLANNGNEGQKPYFFTLVGCMYEGEDNFAFAETYYKMAIDEGYFLGHIELGLMYFYVCANDSTKDFYKTNQIYDTNHNSIELESWYNDNETAVRKYLDNKIWSTNDNVSHFLEQAIDEGHGSFRYGAMGYDLYTHLLFAYRDGIGVNKDYGKAAEVAYKSLEDTDVEIYDYSEGILKSIQEKNEYHKKTFEIYQALYKKATNTYSKFPTQVLRAATTGLGKAYYKGWGTKVDYTQAFKFLSIAADLGDNEAQRLLSACYRYGRGTSVNPQKASEWLEAAGKRDDKAKKLIEQKNKYQ